MWNARTHTSMHTTKTTKSLTHNTHKSMSTRLCILTRMYMHTGSRGKASSAAVSSASDHSGTAQVFLQQCHAGILCLASWRRARCIHLACVDSILHVVCALLCAVSFWGREDKRIHSVSVTHTRLRHVNRVLWLFWRFGCFKNKVTVYCCIAAKYTTYW